MGVALTHNQGANMITIRQRYATARQVAAIGTQLADRVEQLEQTIQEQQQQITELRLHFEHRDERLAALYKMRTDDCVVKNQRVA